MTQRARDLLGPEGPLTRLLPGYEAREAQLTMADAVERALREDRKLICEAGTGTGKTLAYLVPAILSGRKIVVSTATKALQEQIFSKDLPLLARAAGLDADAALIKGLNNYLCLRRYGELRAGPEAPASLGHVERWAAATQTGELAELALPEGDPIRAAIASSSETRIGAPCPHHRECFVTRMKQRAEQSRLLIVNHHLFFADLAARGPFFEGGALPDYDAVIFDEAHQIEDIAADFLGLRVSEARLESLLGDASRSLIAAGLAAPEPLGWLGDDAPTERRRGVDGAVLIDAVKRSAAIFFRMVAATSPTEGTRAPLDPSRWSKDNLATYHRLDTALEALGHLAQQSERDSLRAVVRRIKSLRDDLNEIIDGARSRVAWVEASRSVSMGSSPIRVADQLRSRLFEMVGATVLTSATLATNQGFSFFRDRLGLSDDQGPVDELLLPSPFDFAQNALLYVAPGLPDPQAPDFAARAAERAVDLVRLSAGGAFVLCTSVRAMRAFHARLAREGISPLLLQGEAPKTSLLEQFRAAGSAVLVATMSFWEGVDVPGNALRLVVIDKLPFPVPTDPVVMARTAHIEENGENAFHTYHLPTAAIALKQGFGRLIRSTRDRGVVAVLDRRLLSRGYGPRLLDTLPPARLTEWIEDVAEFFARSFDDLDDPESLPPPPLSENTEEGS